MTKQNFLWALFLICTLKIFSQSAQEFDSEAITKILYQYTNDDAPGMAVGIVKDGQIVYENYLGYANLEHQIKIDKKTRSNIASTAKQFTALMILQLSLEEKLSLEDDIRKYIPSLYTEVQEEIKIRHLINHTSGIRDYVFILEMMNKPFWRQIGMDNDDVIELLEKQEELAFKPGTNYSYSNSGYTILAEIIEKVSGEKFNDYSEKFFQGLGMNETSFVKRYMGVIPNRADSYSDWGNGVWLSTPAVTKFNGDGFLYTTLKDQLIYEQAIQNAHQNNNVLLIKSQQAIPNSEINTYGYGLELDGRLGRVAQYHSGSTFGYHSHTNRFPEEKLSVFVMSNNGKIWSGNIADHIASVLLPAIEKKAADNNLLNESVGEAEQTQSNLPVSLADLEGFVGKYHSNELDMSFELKMTDENKLKISFSNREREREVEALNRNELSASNFIMKVQRDQFDRATDILVTLNKRAQNNRFKKETNLTFQPKIETADGSIQVTTIGSTDGHTSDILLTKNHPNGNEIWYKQFGGSSYDKASSILSTEDGYLIVGSTSSYGNGNYDMFIIKTDKNGKKQWQNTYGDFYNEYGYIAEETEEGFLIKGTKQYCTSNTDVFNRECTTNVWFVSIDKNGKEISNKLLEKVQ